jgi:spore coat polysaccharide biosynthesis protein SpsF
MGATRLPGKVLKKVKGITLLEYEVKRVGCAKKISKIIIATSDKKADDKIEKFCKEIKIDCFRGSENDVLSRYYECASQYPEYKNIIRITGDCPLIDAVVVDEVIKFYEKGKYDYASNVLKETYPDGMDIEVFSRKALEESDENAKLISEREHVTLYIRNNKKYKKGNLEAKNNWSHIRLTVDEKKDFEVIKFLIENSKPTASYLDYIDLLMKNPKIMKKNMNIIRNEGLIKSLKKDKKVL